MTDDESILHYNREMNGSSSTSEEGTSVPVTENGINSSDVKGEFAGMTFEEKLQSAITLIKKNKIAPGLVAKRFGIPRRTLSRYLHIGFMRDEDAGIPEIFTSREGSLVKQEDSMNPEPNIENDDDEANNNINEEIDDDQESGISEGVLQIKEEEEEEDDDVDTNAESKCPKQPMCVIPLNTELMEACSSEDATSKGMFSYAIQSCLYYLRNISNSYHIPILVLFQAYLNCVLY